VPSRAEQVIGTVPPNYRENDTRLAALSHWGIQAVITIDGATNAEVFRANVEQALCPTLSARDIAVLAPLRSHTTAGICMVIKQRAAPLIYSPPSSPDLSPIGRRWSKLKPGLRGAKTRTRETFDTAIAHALATVTEAGARWWFAHAGYA
jgi:transposase